MSVRHPRHRSLSFFQLPIRGWPPTMISLKFPPNALIISSRMVAFILSLMMGTLSKIFMVGVSSFGSTLFLIIFSMMSGTATMRFGFTSSNAWKIIFGLGPKRLSTDVSCGPALLEYGALSKHARVADL